MRYIEAPAEYDGKGPAVFLAGGITGTEDWQSRVSRGLSSIEGSVLTPRRELFPMGSPAEGQRQIEWEYRHLLRADLVAFWFPPETLCPIALFELGTCCSSEVPIVVGAHPDYARRFDICCQLELRRPGTRIVGTIEAFEEAILQHPIMQGAVR